ncbi:hypothetical protein [Herbaspirillum sp. YR522]|uniref:hypothetical protein n=1 Tax=Herbaspirillum sp. YR522 TaxID=1144342 RepID=UPI00026F8856|nr:hypothetical protein [Herbaspirillum sp. YR522]EJN03263.1 hypothetical protein PMI40_02812 [Herbaspirillum sp. YR522]
MKPLHLLMALGLLVSAWLAFFGDKTAQQEVVELPARGNVEPRDARQANMPQNNQVARTPGDAAQPVIQALKPRSELIGEQAGAANGDLFARQNWGAPAASPSPQAPLPAAAVAAASVPVLTYVGKKQEDGVWEVYLSQQDQLFIAREKTVIDGKYRVESIVPPRLMLTYLPSSQKQTMMIGEAQ